MLFHLFRFVTGVQKGRGGLGSIFVWASGNGGRDGETLSNCRSHDEISIVNNFALK